jgi:hypothetical protein
LPQDYWQNRAVIYAALGGRPLAANHFHEDYARPAFSSLSATPDVALSFGVAASSRFPGHSLQTKPPLVAPTDRR